MQAGWHVSSAWGNAVLRSRLAEKRSRPSVTEESLRAAVRCCAGETSLYPSVYDDLGGTELWAAPSHAPSDADASAAGGRGNAAAGSAERGLELQQSSSEICAAAGRLRYEAEWAERAEVMHRLLWGMWRGASQRGEAADAPASPG
jgi:hypothetical protein